MTRSRRGLLAVPGIVLIVCLFLPALRVCGDPTTPITFPPCYGVYVGGIGLVIMALATGRRLLAVGAAIAPALAILTLGGLALCCFSTEPHVGALAVGLAGASLAFAVMPVYAFLRSPPSPVAMAAIAIVQGAAAVIWGGLLALDPEGMWGADLTLVAGLAIVLVGICWLDAALDARPPRNSAPLPRAISRRSRR